MPALPSFSLVMLMLNMDDASQPALTKGAKLVHTKARGSVSILFFFPILGRQYQQRHQVAC